MPDAELGRRETPNQRRAREGLERLKKTQGPGFFGALAASIGPTIPNVRFIRRGYESGIVDELREFYAKRPRPWRPARNAPKIPHKERLQAQRRRANGHA